MRPSGSECTGPRLGFHCAASTIHLSRYLRAATNRPVCFAAPELEKSVWTFLPQLPRPRLRWDSFRPLKHCAGVDSNGRNTHTNKTWLRPLLCYRFYNILPLRLSKQLRRNQSLKVPKCCLVASMAIMLNRLIMRDNNKHYIDVI